MQSEDETDEAPTVQVSEARVATPPPENRFGLRLAGVLMATGPIPALRRMNLNAFEREGVLVRLNRRKRKGDET